MTVSPVHAYSGSRSRTTEMPHEGLKSDFTKLEIVVPAVLVDRVVAAITQAGHTGRAGDGIVFVVPIERFTRIRDLGAVPPNPTALPE
ncbi:MAG: P-II family nitrogen regulator [Vicinamibacterales bacterium]